MEYWAGLPEEHHTALFQLRDEDFAAELDAHLKYQLRICKDCRGNVTRAFRWGACMQCLPAQRGAALGRVLRLAPTQGTVPGTVFRAGHLYKDDSTEAVSWPLTASCWRLFKTLLWEGMHPGGMGMQGAAGQGRRRGGGHGGL